MVAHCTVRVATEEELRQVLPEGLPGYETWAAVALEDEQCVGHVCLSRALGQVIGHSWAFWGEDKHGPCRLLLAARRQLRTWRPDEQFLIHFSPTDTQTLEFWTKRGFQPTLTLYQRTLICQQQQYPQSQ